MRAKQFFEYLAYGIVFVAVVVLFTPNLRTSFFKLFDSKPYIELTDTNDLRISGFVWGYGMIGINQFNGDFDKLDHKVFDLLKGKSGSCRVFMQATSKDKYGNADSTYNYIGDIDINELNKFTDWQYWQKANGIRKLLYNKFIKRDEPMVVADSAKVDATAIDTVTVPATTTTIAKTYSFSIDDLYPSLEKQQVFDQHHFSINGTIGAVNYENGIMEINTDEGETLTIQFYPMDASSYNQQQLMLALKQGNKINSICARAGASTLDLLSADIVAN